MLLPTVGPRKLQRRRAADCGHGAVYVSGWRLRLTRPTHRASRVRPPNLNPSRFRAGRDFSLLYSSDHVLFRGALIGNPLNVDRAVLVLRRFWLSDSGSLRPVRYRRRSTTGRSCTPRLYSGRSLTCARVMMRPLRELTHTSASSSMPSRSASAVLICA